MAPSGAAAPRLLAAALLALTLAAYSTSLGNGFVWDDDDYVTANATLRSADGLRRIWLEPGAVPQYYPLTFTSLWIDYRLGGLEPFGYHLVNVLLHGANAVLAWLVLRRLSVPFAWLAAAVFAVHPVHVESVAWVTERKNVLSGLFYLAAMLAYLRWAGIGAGGAPGRRAGYAASLVLFVCGLLAKTVVCTLPAALLLLAWWKRGRLTTRDVAPLVPFFAIGGALALVTVRMESQHVGAVGADWDLSFVDRCLIAGRAVWFYLGKLAWPSRLTFIYPRWTIDSSAVWQVLFPAAAAAAAAALFALRRRIGDAPLVALLFFVMTLGPALGFVNVFPMRYSFVADHFQYLASLGPIALAAAALATLAAARGEPGRRAATALGAAVLLALGLLTVRQTAAYRDLRTLWTDTLAKNPGAWMAHNNLGLLLFDEGDVAGAIEHYRAAIAVKPDDAFARNNLGRSLAALGRLDEAAAALRGAVAADPSHAEAWNNLGNVLAARGSHDDAVASYERALAIRPLYADARSNLGNVLWLTGRPEQAIASWEAALRIDPGYVDARQNLGIALAAQGRLDEAGRELAEVVRLRPSSAEAQRELGRVLERQGRRAEAMAHEREAARLTPQGDRAGGAAGGEPATR